MRLTVWRVIAFLLLIAISVGFGFAFDAIATTVEKNSYPRPESLASAIAENAAAYGVPEAILWATVRNGSNFASNEVSEDGAVGLMQLTPAQFDMIRTELLGKETIDAGMLYDPATNLQCGSAWLSHLYEHYGIWKLAFAAYHAGIDTVDGWLADPELTDENGILKSIPNKEIAAYVQDMEKAVQYYSTLYYE